MKTFYARALALLLCLVLLPRAYGAEAGEDYRLGAGDIIKVSVYEYPDLTTEMRVGEGGTISFPLIGEVQVVGLTPIEAERLIRQKLTDGGFIQQPNVTVLVEQFKSQEVRVLGVVNKPGTYPLEKPSTVLDALALAGGLMPGLAGDSASLVRDGGEKIAVDLYALLEGDLSHNHPIKTGDTLIVPKAPQFYIYGEVLRPGIYKLEHGMTMSRAISTGGGLTPKGTEWWPVVKRRSPDGKEEEIDVEGDDLLQADDVVYIRESWF